MVFFHIMHSMTRWIIFVSIFALAVNVANSQDGERVYNTYCRSCHGTQMEGNSASALIKTEWKYGNSRNDLIRNVKLGIVSTDMPAWEQALKEKEITDVVDFIMAAQKSSPVDKHIVPSQLATKDYSLKVEKFVESGLSEPWGIEFVDKDHALISERSGNIRWVINGKLDPKKITGLPLTHYQSSTGGYMDIALDPAYSTNGWIYLAFSHTNGDVSDEKALALTKIVRGKIKDYNWRDEQTLFEVPDSLMVVEGNRWGCRFLFDKAGYLYFSIGDMGKAMDSQHPGRATGKVFRINPDGSIPRDNPFIRNPSALPAIFTLGNRNVQGLVQHPVTGEIWATEHGPKGGDELNILKNGHNYGWPLITFGVDYSGEPVSDKTHLEGMEQPIIQWTPSIAVCPAEFSTSALFPKWKNNLLVGALGFEELRRLVIEKNNVIEQEMILKGSGRVRDIKTGPDGALYVLLNKPDMILRITPAGNSAGK